MDHSGYDNEYNRQVLATYLRLAKLQKNPKYVQQNWETDKIRTMPWGNYGEYRTHNYKVLSSGGNIAKQFSEKTFPKKNKKQPMKVIQTLKKQTFSPTVIIPKTQPKPYINLTIADLEDNKTKKTKSGIQLLSRLL